MSTPGLPERAGRTALCPSRLFDGHGYPLVGRPVVVLEHGKVVSIQREGPPPGDAERVDLEGATLLPGLVDTHVHLVLDAGPTPVDSLAARTAAEVVEAARRAARVALLGGVTTVRDLGDRNYLTLSLRGDPELPRILSAGPPITTPAGHCHFLGGGVAGTPDRVRAAVREHVERGVDVIKIMASGGTLTPGTFQHVAQFSPETLTAAVNEAHRLGVPITAHAHGTGAVRDCLSAGVDGMEHVTFWSELGIDEPGDLIDRIARQQVVVGATMGSVRDPRLPPPPPEILQRLPRVMANVGRMYAAGARVVVGSDAGIAPGKPHDAVRHSAPDLVNMGLSPIDVLRTLTSLAADALGVGGSTGRIAVGMDADLLAVDGDPLQDLAALHRIRAVFRRGRRVR